MIEEEQTVALFIAANPVPDPDLLDPVEPLDHIDDPSGWGDVLVYTELERPEANNRARPRLLVLVAGAATIAMVGLVAWLDQDRTDGPASSGEVPASASDGPVLLAPPADLAALVVTEAAHGPSDPGFVRGAVRTPSGEIIGITIGGQVTGPGQGGPAPIEGGRTVVVDRALIDEEPEQFEDFFTYRVGSDCYWVSVRVSDGLETASPWNYAPPEIERFFQQLTITDGGSSGDGETVTIELPPGWESLGIATVSDRYILHFSAELEAIDSEFEMDQRPATGVGVFLANPGRTNPHPTTLSGRPAWVMTDTDGWITLVFDDDGTAVSLRARGINEEQLVAFAATLERRLWGETSALVSGANPTQTPVDEQLAERETPVPVDCGVTLEFVEEGGAGEIPAN